MDPASSPIERCANCQQELRLDRAAGLTYCSGCGTSLVPSLVAPPNEPPLAERSRRQLKFCFWSLFLLTPVAGVLVSSDPDWVKDLLPDFITEIVPLPLKVISTLGIGVLASSYCLVQLQDQDRSLAQVVSGTILMALGLLVGYFCIAFVGCGIIAVIVHAVGH
jgi:hypothetical protein